MSHRTKVAAYDLARPATIWGLEQYRAVWLLVHNNFVPAGFLQIDLARGEIAISSERVRQLVMDEFGRLENTTAELSDFPPISVVVCTRNRPYVLRRCLAAITKLEYPNFEVIVVDNASTTNETEAVIRETPFRYVREDRVGVDNARNRGWTEARHEIIAYTDDDAAVNPRWLHGIALAFADSSISGATGLVLPLELEMQPQLIFEQYGGMSKGFRQRDFLPATMKASDLIAAHSLGVGANMAFRRSALEQLGGFDPCLDVGTVSSGAGDLDMFHRVLAAGFKMHYEPSAFIWHQHRRDIHGLRRQIYNNGRSFGVYLMKIWSQQSTSRSAVIHYAMHNWLYQWLFRRAWQSIVGPRTAECSLAWTELRGALSAPYAYRRTYAKSQVSKGRS